MSWLVGLDLGQAADFTALAALERSAEPDPSRVPGGPDPHGRARGRYAVRWLQRWPLGTPYTEVAAGARDRLSDPRLAGCRCAADYTGVGRPVVDMLRKERVPCRLEPVLVTAGSKVTWDEKDRCWHVPKKDLVAALQVVLQQRRLEVAAGLKEAPRLKKELSDFRVKVTAAANATFGAWGDGQHDDLVFAVALAVWLGERRPLPAGRGVAAPAPGRRNVTETAPRGVFLS